MKTSAALLAFLSICWISTVHAQPLPVDQLHKLADRHARVSLQECFDFFSLPNDAHYPEQLEPNIQWVEAAFGKRGFRTTRLATPTIPLVLAEWRAPAAAKTILFYMQVDGQPVDPGKWQQPTPFTPTLKAKNVQTGQWETLSWQKLSGEIDPDWRIYARSASDAKGPINAFLAAWDAMLEAGRKPDYHVKIILDTEEELGSPHLPEAVVQYREQLAADYLLILDGPQHATNKPTLVFGARGIADLRLTTFGPKVPQHSGHYGNYAPNPALLLSQLLSSMKDEQGKVIIPGFYDGIVISPEVEILLRQTPDDETEIRQRLGIVQPDGVGRYYQESLQYPSLNIRGMASAWVGDQVRTIVPDKAVAEIDMRLVVESDPKRLIQLVRRHIEAQGFHLIGGDVPTDEERNRYARLAKLEADVSYLAFRTEMTHPVGLWARKALERAHGNLPVLIRTHGGSIPIAPFVQTLNVPAVAVPTVNPDNNQHSPNENIRLGNYFSGVRSILSILTQPL